MTLQFKYTIFIKLPLDHFSSQQSSWNVYWLACYIMHMQNHQLSMFFVELHCS